MENQQYLIAAETKRISDKYGKSFLNCKDIMEVTGLGRDTIRALMKSSAISSKKIGRKRIVSVINFVTWQLAQNKEA